MKFSTMNGVFVFVLGVGLCGSAVAAAFLSHGHGGPTATLDGGLLGTTTTSRSSNIVQLSSSSEHYNNLDHKSNLQPTNPSYAYAYGGNTLREGHNNWSGNVPAPGTTHRVQPERATTEEGVGTSRVRSLEERLDELQQQDAALEHRWLDLQRKTVEVEERSRSSSSSSSSSSISSTLNGASVRRIRDLKTRHNNIVQGGSLRTWSFPHASSSSSSSTTTRSRRAVHVQLRTEGRPLDASVELWHGPNYTPLKMRVYAEDGQARPFHAFVDLDPHVIQQSSSSMEDMAMPQSDQGRRQLEYLNQQRNHPRNYWGSHTIAVRNTGLLEFPLTAVLNRARSVYNNDGGVEADVGDGRLMNANACLHALDQAHAHQQLQFQQHHFSGPYRHRQQEQKQQLHIQGGAIRTYAFPSTVQSVALRLVTDGRPLQARIELMQGPNANKQVMEIYSEDGGQRPFSALIPTPFLNQGGGHVIRIINTAPVEFPMSVVLVPEDEDGIVGQNNVNDYRDDDIGWARTAVPSGARDRVRM